MVLEEWDWGSRGPVASPRFAGMKHRPGTRVRDFRERSKSKRSLPLLSLRTHGLAWENPAFREGDERESAGALGPRRLC